MRIRILIGTVLATFFAALFLSAPLRAEEKGQSPHTMKKEVKVTVEMNYLLFLPEDYGKKKDQKWPVIMFLHGSGERGTDINKVKAHGPPKIVETKKDFQFIVISPQCLDGKWWEPEVLIALLDEVSAKYAVDQNRVYLTGLSMGGFGTWETAIAYPDRFAAIVPICGGGNKYRADALKNIPTWVFHGEKDQAVPIERSVEMVEGLKRAGGDVIFTRYPEAGHDSWTASYNNPELYKWMLSHKKK